MYYILTRHILTTRWVRLYWTVKGFGIKVLYININQYLKNKIKRITVYIWCVLAASLKISGKYTR